MLSWCVFLLHRELQQYWPTSCVDFVDDSQNTEIISTEWLFSVWDYFTLFKTVPFTLKLKSTRRLGSLWTIMQMKALQFPKWAFSRKKIFSQYVRLRNKVEKAGPHASTLKNRWTPSPSPPLSLFSRSLPLLIFLIWKRKSKMKK